MIVAFLLRIATITVIHEFADVIPRLCRPFRIAHQMVPISRAIDMEVIEKGFASWVRV